MAGGAKVVINLATGLEDPERVTVAFLVGGAAVEQGKQVAMFLTKEAVRLAVPAARRSANSSNRSATEVANCSCVRSA